VHNGFDELPGLFVGDLELGSSAVDGQRQAVAGWVVPDQVPDEGDEELDGDRILTSISCRSLFIELQHPAPIESSSIIASFCKLCAF
jgi:hypothetical protein